MKFIRFGEPGQERPGLVDAGGTIRDLSAIVEDVSMRHLTKDVMRRLAATDPQSLPPVDSDVRIGPCLADVRNLISIGLNYVDHAIESNAPIPAEPVVFNKLTSCISGPNDPVVLLKGSQKTDWEVEVAMVIGAPTYLVDEAQALASIAGLCICHDISERDLWSAWPMAGHARRTGHPEPRPVAGRQRYADADRNHRQDDFRLRRHRLLSLAIHEAHAR